MQPIFLKLSTERWLNMALVTEANDAPDGLAVFIMGRELPVVYKDQDRRLIMDYLRAHTTRA